jgi:predicted acetyltransferase
LSSRDERACLDAHRELLNDHFEFALGYEDRMAWEDYLARLESERLGRHLRRGHVPSTFLAAEAHEEIVGRISIRHALNEFLAHEGGHIGFAVRPTYRRRGYATAILSQGLVIARSLGVERVLVTCDRDNRGSATVIQRCGGVLETVVDGQAGNRVCRYWID